jgi:long-chain acyl-CoA synthetase
VRELHRPPSHAVPRSGNLTDDVVRNGTEHPDAVAFSVRRGDAWHEVTAGQFLAEVRDVAGGLVAGGVEPGDRVALLARTSYEWTLVDYAIWFAGGVTVPVYATATPEQAGAVLADSGATALVVETEEQRARWSPGRSGLPELERVWCLASGAVAELAEAGRAHPADDLEALRRAAGPETLATLVYTPGTTGRPRGCMLTHGNLMFEVGAALEELDELFSREDAATLLVLPLASVFARVVQVGAVRARVRLGHCTDVRRLSRDLREFRPTFVVAVPRLLEQVVARLRRRAAADGRRAQFDRGVTTAVAWSRAIDARRPGPALRLRRLLYERPVHGRLRDAWGGRCEHLVVGGAPLGDRLAHLHRGVGLAVLEGYGMTETTAAVSVNRPGATRLGTVGRPLGGTSVRVAEDGELLVRGGQVFAGYWADGSPAGAPTDDGWLRTGDVGEIDDDGFVAVRGRRSDLLVTAGGKSVSPTVLEHRIRAHPLVSQCLVVGDGRPYLAALVTLDEAAALHWATARGKPAQPAALVADPELAAEIQAAVDEANTAVSRAEAVRRFLVLPTDWTEEDGQLTPAREVRRAVLLQQLGREVDDLYAG